MGREKKVMSFYDFMMHFYLKEPDRYALAYDMKRLSRRHPELKEINSLTDLMAAADLFDDREVKAAASGDLWAEYCARCGRPFES